MAPNPRAENRDLLEVRVPGPLERASFGWIAQTAQLQFEDHLAYRGDARFDPPVRDVSLRELLRICADREKDEDFNFDAEKLEMTLTPKPPESEWLQSLREWFP